MSCAQPYAAETLLRGALRLSEAGCAAFAMNPAIDLGSDTLFSCGDAIAWETIAGGVIGQDGLLSVNSFTGGGTDPILCDEAEITLSELMASVIIKTTTGYAVNLYFDPDIGECDVAACEDTSTLAQMMRAAFARLQNNGTMLMRARLVDAGAFVQCGEAEGMETILRRAFSRAADGGYELMVVQ